jgi:hemoglobin
VVSLWKRLIQRFGFGQGAAVSALHENQIYEVVGEEGFRRLIAAFYAQVPDDDVLGPMYPQGDLAGAEDRLRGFLIFRFGGPQTYIEERGHPRLRGRHAPFTLDQAARDRWVQLMDNAFAIAELPEAAVAVMKPFLAGVATFLLNSD